MKELGVIPFRYVWKPYWETKEQKSIEENGRLCVRVFLLGHDIQLPLKHGVPIRKVRSLGYEIAKQTKEVAAAGLSVAKECRALKKFPKELRGFIASS